MSQQAVMTNSDANEEIIEILIEKDELNWKNLIYELIRTEQMNPWDIDVSKLAEKFLEMLRTLQDMDFRITGKIVLAAALLLKTKSDHLLEEDMEALDSLIEGAEEPVELLDEMPQPYEVVEETEEDTEEEDVDEESDLIPRTPQPRQRKVSVHDLVGALDKALEKEMKRIKREKIDEAEEVEMPDDDEIDISVVIRDIYEQIYNHYSENDETLTFSRLIPEDGSKDDKVFTFIPLLHLDNQRNIDLNQEAPFEEIFIDFLEELGDDFAVDEGNLGAL